MAKTKGKYILNPLVLGFEWVAESGTVYQLVAAPGIRAALTMGVKPTAGVWSQWKCDDKWTCDGTAKDFKRVVEQFMAEGEVSK